MRKTGYPRLYVVYGLEGTARFLTNINAIIIFVIDAISSIRAPEFLPRCMPFVFAYCGWLALPSNMNRGHLNQGSGAFAKVLAGYREERGTR